jgi:hypothetical protein
MVLNQYSLVPKSHFLVLTIRKRFNITVVALHIPDEDIRFMFFGAFLVAGLGLTVCLQI